jgi:hypothetical protein
MKKKRLFYGMLVMVLIFGMAVGCTSTSTPSEKPKLDIPVPIFDKPHSIVLDMWSYGSSKYEDYVKVYNSTLHENISFNVFGYDEKNQRWVLIGVAKLKKVTDRATIDSPLNGELNHFRWFAIHSLNNLDFNAQAVINRNDVLITVFEEGLKDW